MKALIISGGGSKGAFAGGVAEYLINDMGNVYDLFLGTSTGSLLTPHLALGDIGKIKKIYSSVSQSTIFDQCPFVIKKKHGTYDISINHFKVLKRLLSKKRSFGESKNLLKHIKKSLTPDEFEKLKRSDKDVVVTVSNISLNEVEYKSINDCDYQEFCEWIWISSNYPPFMSLVNKNGCDYADGGLGDMVPIEEALKRGAKELDVIVLETEVNYINRLPIRNPFALITNMVNFMMDRIEHQNIRIGRLSAQYNDATINIYHTPTVLTTNSLVFDKKNMTRWWKQGYEYAIHKNNSNRI